jgi:hypothetical protein
MVVLKIKGGVGFWIDGWSIKKDGTRGKNRAWTTSSYGTPMKVGEEK